MWDVNSQTTRPWFWASILMSVSILGCVFFYPLGSDACVFQWEALRFVRDGAIPYIGTWEHNLPGVLFFHLLPALLFGNSETGFRLFEVLFHTCVVIELYVLLTRFVSPRAGFLSCLLYATSFLRGGYIYYGQRDVFAAGLLIVIFEVWTRERMSLILRTTVISILFSVIVLIRPLYAPFPITMLVIYWKMFSARERIAFVIAAVVLPILFISPYIISGHLSDVIAPTVIFIGRMYPYIGSPGPSEFIRMSLTFWPVIVLSVIPMLLAVWPRSERSMYWRSQRDRWFFAALIIESVLIVILQHRYLVYHYAVTIVLLCPLGGVALDGLIGRLLKAQSYALIAAAVALVWFTPSLNIVNDISGMHWMRSPYMVDDVAQQAKRWRVQDDNVIAYLREPQNRDGACEVCSYDDCLRLRLDREPASRFAEFQGLTIGDAQQRHPQFQETWRQEFIDSILRRPARFVILNGYMNFWNYPSVRDGLQSNFSELTQTLSTYYVKDTTIDSYAIYRLKNDRIAVLK